MTGSSPVIATPHPKGKRPPIRFLSVCSGIEAASQALNPLGFKAVAFSEIDKFACAVLKHRHPDVPNWGDMTKFQEWPDADLDALFGGTPCQPFSVAGLREGLADPRGNLMLTFGAVAARYRPRWIGWENVPGVLSSNNGRDFASFLGLITGQQIEPPAEGWRNAGIIPGIADAYGVAYRVLDAQHVRTRGKPRAVPQRRRRVFVIGYIGDWTRAAAVLFDAESLRRDPPPRREAGKGVAPTISARPTGGGGLGTDFDLDGGLIPSHDVAQPLLAKANSSHRADAESDAQDGIAPTLRAMGHADSHQNGGGQLAVAYSIQAGALRENPEAGPDGVGVQEGHAYTLEARAEVQAVAFDLAQITSKTNRTRVAPDLPASTLNAAGQMHLATPWAVRRLTPRECERLQGMADDVTNVPWRGKGTSPDGPRYKAIGNSWALNCIEWIGERMLIVDAWE